MSRAQRSADSGWPALAQDIIRGALQARDRYGPWRSRLAVHRLARSLPREVYRLVPRASRCTAAGTRQKGGAEPLFRGG